MKLNDWPVDRAVTCLSLQQKVLGLNLGPVKSDTVLPTAQNRCNISLKGAVLHGGNDWRWALQTRYKLQHSIKGIMKDLID